MHTNLLTSTRSLSAWLMTLMLAIVLSGCSTVKLVGDYDEQIDKGATQLQKDVESLLVKLEGTGKTPPKYSVDAYNQVYADTYADFRVALSGLRVRADSMERNSLTVRMLDQLGNNLRRLEDMHQEGLTRQEIQESLRGAINAQFTAILTFELAKKRGEKPDEAKSMAAPTRMTQSQGESK